MDTCGAALLSRRAARSGAVAWRALVLGALAGLLAVQPAMVSAQGIAAVFDAQNFLRNTQAVIEATRQVQLTMQDLAPLTNLGEALNVAVSLQRVLGQVRTIAGRISGRRHLWSAAYPIERVAQLAAFKSSSGQLCRSVITDALGVQGLIAEATELLTTLTVMIDSLDVLIQGTVSGLQSVSTQLGSVNGQLVLLQTLQAGNNEAGLCEQWAMAVTREAVLQLQQHLFRDYGQVGDMP